MTGHPHDCPCLECTHRRLRNLARAAGRLRANLDDLHTIGWEPATAGAGPAAENVDQGERTARDWTPRAGDLGARRLLGYLASVAARAEAALVGCEREMLRVFDAAGPIVVGGQRTLISREEFDRAEKNQRRRAAEGQYTPNRLTDQPQHPSGRRR